MASLPPKLTRLLMYGNHFVARLVRPMTLGVRAIVVDGQDRVLLVRHSYVPGWHLPGGAVDAGETLHQALVREVREETAVEMTGRGVLHGIFYNDRYSRRDHVAVFIVREFRLLGPRKPDWEIREARFFSLTEAPATVTRATRARLAEALDGQDIAERW